MKKEKIFWTILRFCFLKCPFEELNYENFDSIVTKMINLIVKEIKLYKKKEIFDILIKIIEFEIKKEIEIPNFKARIQKIFKDLHFNRDKVQKTLNPLFDKFRINDVYYSNLKSIFNYITH